ncbi:DUF5938 domain-containing protein [Nocardioides sp. Root151]|uniref:DUF5938 domain-containing protein n=1 Tax=Nocardioides sp. Root151 TaxID=1736475 RepID=UPI0007156C56|nr:DUF5938 domain-containing protein [Nocardioides sp. Root151]KQZ68722.1 hypothetical protein ASD66_15720 [Nocardioides sp. Root151]
MTASPAVIYGQAGQLSRAIADQLDVLGVPFTLLEPQRDDADDLTAQFTGATVVMNLFGPFADTGHTVVEAALRAGCHYLDASDEMDWLVKARETWHQQFVDAGLALVPGLAQPFATSEIAAQLSLETPGAELLDVMLLWQGASAPSSALQLQRVVKENGFDLADVLSWPMDRTLHVRLPEHTEPGLAIRLDDSPHCLWFGQDDRVTELRAYGGAAERSSLVSLMSHPSAEHAVAEGRSPLAMDQTVDASIDSVWSMGSGRRTHVVLAGTCPYAQTAVLHAAATRALLTGGATHAGFGSGSQAFGHRFLLDALQEAGVIEPPVVTIGA